MQQLPYRADFLYGKCEKYKNGKTLVNGINSTKVKRKFEFSM